jgi:hypothetical protein
MFPRFTLTAASVSSPSALIFFPLLVTERFGRHVTFFAAHDDEVVTFDQSETSGNQCGSRCRRVSYV